MKVICINENFTNNDPGMPLPKFGDIDEVTAISKFNEYTYYGLKNMGPYGRYISTHFAELSDLDGVEILNYQKETEKV